MRRDALLLVLVTAVIAIVVAASALASSGGSGTSDGAAASAASANGGCSQGFWKSTPSAWAGTGFSPNQTVESVFDVPDAFGLDNVTLLEALSLGGGSSTKGAAMNLLRVGVTALLNSTQLGYGLPTGSVVSQVNAALASNSRSAMVSLFTSLSNRNGQFGNCGTPAPTATATSTPVPPTNTPTDTPTNTPVVPTNTPTDPPTNTPVPPTNTPTDTPTNTPVP